MPDTYTFLGPKRPQTPHPNVHGYAVIQKSETGETIEDVFARADHVFEHTFTVAREFQGFLEPRACVVWIDEDDRVHVINTNKAPAQFRRQLAAGLGIPADRIVVDTTFIGGDFGGKGLSIDEYACYFLARATGRPIKSVMSYVDEMQASNSRHPAIIKLRTAVDRDGRFLAHQSDAVIDGGAYAAGKAAPTLVVPAHQTLVAVPHPGHAAGSQGRLHQQHPRRLDARAGRSAVDVRGREPRRHDRQRSGHRPDRTAPSERGARRRPQRHRRDHSPGRGRLRCWTSWSASLTGTAPCPLADGRGVALGVRHIGAGATSVQVRLGEDGMVEVVTGVVDQGVGTYTVLRRVAAAVMSVDPKRIVVRHCDTDGPAPDPGVGGQRVTHVLGRAAQAGATRTQGPPGGSGGRSHGLAGR